MPNGQQASDDCLEAVYRRAHIGVCIRAVDRSQRRPYHFHGVDETDAELPRLCSHAGQLLCLDFLGQRKITDGRREEMDSIVDKGSLRLQL